MGGVRNGKEIPAQLLRDDLTDIEWQLRTQNLSLKQLLYYLPNPPGLDILEEIENTLKRLELLQEDGTIVPGIIAGVNLSARITKAVSASIENGCTIKILQLAALQMVFPGDSPINVLKVPYHFKSGK